MNSKETLYYQNVQKTLDFIEFFEVSTYCVYIYDTISIYKCQIHYSKLIERNMAPLSRRKGKKQHIGFKSSDF